MASPTSPPSVVGCQLTRHPQCVADRSVVIEEGSHKHLGIRRLHHLGHTRVADLAPVRSHVLLVALWYQALGSCGAGGGRSESWAEATDGAA